MPRKKSSESLSADRLIQAAIAVADEYGIEALTMRRLATTLGVSPMALYYYVPDKGTLLRHVVRSLFHAMKTPDSGGSWQERVRAWALAYRDLALAHANLALQIAANPEAVAIAAADANAALYSALQAAGLSDAKVEGTAALIVDFINGYVLGASAAHKNGMPGAASSNVGFEAPSVEDSFAVGLDVILAGIETVAARTSRA